MKRMLIDQNSPVGISAQSQLLSLSRSTLYYAPEPVSAGDLALLHRLDEIYTASPFFGSRRLANELREEGTHIGRDKVRTLMRLLGIEAIYAKPNLSKRHPDHKIFPYLLRGLKVSRPNQVWSTDITYIRLTTGFIYLIAVIDWYSRYVLSWRLSPNLNVDFCIEALQEALSIATPEYFNVDQGSQFTSPSFYQLILDRGIKYSMDGRGRFLDNIFVEQLWRTIKQENIYISGYSALREAFHGLCHYFDFYNMFRGHQAFGYETPFVAYTA
jgi:putative transposase